MTSLRKTQLLCDLCHTQNLELNIDVQHEVESGLLGDGDNGGEREEERVTGGSGRKVHRIHL